MLFRGNLSIDSYLEGADDFYLALYQEVSSWKDENLPPEEIISRLRDTYERFNPVTEVTKVDW